MTEIEIVGMIRKRQNRTKMVATVPGLVLEIDCSLAPVNFGKSRENEQGKTTLPSTKACSTVNS